MSCPNLLPSGLLIATPTTISGKVDEEIMCGRNHAINHLSSRIHLESAAREFFPAVVEQRVFPENASVYPGTAGRRGGEFLGLFPPPMSGLFAKV